MSGAVAVLWAGARAEALHLRRAPVLVVLVCVQAVTFLLLVSLFGLTGSKAPTALVVEDNGAYARHFVADLRAAHHSFALRPMTAVEASRLLRQGDLVAVITIPRTFSQAVARGQTVPIRVDVDNIDVDLTDDIQRALPSAIVAFAHETHLPGIHLQPAERDLVAHDTGFIPYLVVSALALDALTVAGVLGALTVAREFESGTIGVLASAPIPPLLPLAGRLLAVVALSALAMLLTAAIVVAGYGITPVHPVEMAAGLLVDVVIFTCIGAALGAALRRTLPVAPLVFGLSLPLYIDSGALEPERFDGNIIWTLAHLSPVYYAVGVLEDAVHGLVVTPESTAVDFLACVAWAVLALAVAALLTRRRLRT